MHLPNGGSTQSNGFDRLKHLVHLAAKLALHLRQSDTPISDSHNKQTNKQIENKQTKKQTSYQRLYLREGSSRHSILQQRESLLILLFPRRPGCELRWCGNSHIHRSDSHVLVVRNRFAWS
jgi:hypothetical protein